MINLLQQSVLYQTESTEHSRATQWGSKVLDQMASNFWTPLTHLPGVHLGLGIEPQYFISTNQISNIESGHWMAQQILRLVYYSLIIYFQIQIISLLILESILLRLVLVWLVLFKTRWKTEELRKCGLFVTEEQKKLFCRKASSYFSKYCFVTRTQVFYWHRYKKCQMKPLLQ